MSDFVKKYNAATSLAMKFRMAPRAEWVKPGSRAKDNHAILIPRKEAVKMADELASWMYNGYVWMYESLNLREYLSQLADGEDDAEICEVCGNTYRRGRIEGRCPCCAAGDAAAEHVREMLRGEEND